METNAVIYLALDAARVFEGDPTIRGNGPFEYEVYLQRIEPNYIVVRLPIREDDPRVHVLYIPWSQVHGVIMAEGEGHFRMQRG